MANIEQRPDSRFLEKIKNFPTNLYRVDDRNSHIFKLLYTLLEIGVGQVKGIQDIANQSQNSLALTEGSDLDQFYQLFGIRRDGQFVYDGNLFSDGTVDSFVEFKSLDARFRIAISKMLQAFQKGGTPEGIRLLAEASSSYPVQVIEPWKTITEYNRTNTPESEVIVLIKPNLNLSDEEVNNLKSKVIRDLEIIRPAGIFLTVHVDNPPDNSNTENDTLLNVNYAAAGNFTFLSDGSNQYSELLSQEKEVDINSFVINANSYKIVNDYKNFIGTLQSSINSTDSIIIVNESSNINWPTFFIKLSNNNQEEILWVSNRSSFTQDDLVLFAYEVERGAMSTSSFTWSAGTNIFVNFIELNNMITESETTFDSWYPIPKADSPDNYPLGKFSNDSSRYDSEGSYLFEWSSQDEYRDFFKQQIQLIGGEVQGENYRLPLINNNSTANPQLMAALAASYPVLRPIVRPS